MTNDLTAAADAMRLLNGLPGEPLAMEWARLFAAAPGLAHAVVRLEAERDEAAALRAELARLRATWLDRAT